MAQTIRPARKNAATGSAMPLDLELPQGEPVSPPSSDNSGDDEDWGSEDERRGKVDQFSATGTASDVDLERGH